MKLIDWLRLRSTCLMVFFLGLALFFIGPQKALAQRDRVITGTVLDLEGKPIEGAVVKVPQTNFITHTQKNGTFLLNTPASATMIVVSAKGKQLQRLSIQEQVSLTIRMQPFATPDEDDEENKATPARMKGEGGVSGTVTDEKGVPLSGVSIRVKNSPVATVSNDAGQFLLLPPGGKTILEVSAVGHTSKEVVIDRKQPVVDITLSSTSVSLEEVVVVGYNTQKKVNLTGSVASVDFKNLQNVPQSNTINMLQGRVPGVSIVQPGGQPGADQGTISIRGIGTLNDAAPLVIIDGVQSSLSDLGNLSPTEIATVSVLKDAASAAIYGARGANGVILVSTREPGKRKLQINFNAFRGIQSATYLPKFVDSWQWMTLHNEAAGEIYDSTTIAKLKNGEFSDSLANTKWPQELFRPAGMESYTVNVNGGNQQVAYQASLGYLNQDGIMENTSTRRYNFRTNVRAQINSQLESGLNIWGYVQDTREPFGGVSAVMTAMNQAYPYVPLRTSEGLYGVYGYADGRAINNPLLLTEIGRNDLEAFKSNLQTYVQWQPLSALRLRTAITYSFSNEYRERFNPTYSYPDLGGKPTFTNNNAQLVNAEAQDKQLQWQTTAIYNKIFGGKHAVTLLGGHEFVSFKTRQFSATGFGLPNNDLQVLGAAVTNFNVGGSKQQWALQSYFSRANYVFDNKYLLEANFRIDGSSRFQPQNRYGYFPAFSAGWILSKEKFFVNLDKVVSLLKLRAGWGKTGNDRIGNFTFSQFINLGGFYSVGGALQPAGSVTEYGNPGVRWESTTTTNYGMDLGFLRNKLLLNVDVFDRVTEDILFRLPLPSSFGNVDAPIQNIGRVSNQGWELNLDHRNSVGRSFTYNIGLNVSYVQNRIEKLNQQESIYGNSRFILREGEAINSFYGYLFDGLYRDSADLAKYPRFSSSGFQLGTTILRDVNKDGKIDAADRVVLGNANTPYTFGLTGGVSYKGFDLNFLFQGVSGKKVYIYDFGNRPGNAGNTNFWKEWWDNRYEKNENPGGNWPVLKRTAPEIGQITNSFFLRDASYIRLKNIELGYSLPSGLLSAARIRTLRVYVTGQNLLTFSRLIKQIDPERDALSTSNSLYPQTKIVTFGINLGL